MSSPHITALAVSLAIYASLALSYYGWGKIAARVFRIDTHRAPFVSIYIWLGWLITLLVYQLIHLVLPLTGYVSGVTLGAGLIYAVIDAYNHAHRVNPAINVKKLISGIPFIIGAVLISSWISARSMLPFENVDSGLYHLQTMKWFNTFPIVRGLGNLHVRFAYNQTFFVYAASLNFTPFFGHGRSIANSFLFLLTLATFVEELWHTFRAGGVVHNRRLSLPAISALLSFPVLVFLALSSNGFSSPTPDLASSLIQLILIYLLSKLVMNWRTNDDDHLAPVTLGLLASTSITMKLSNVAIACVILCLVFLKLRKTGNQQLAWIIFSTSAVLAVIWVCRGYILSGVPLFPSTFGKLPFRWTMPDDKILAEFDFIKGWARSKSDWMSTLGTTSWLSAWLNKQLAATTEFVVPVVLSVLFLLPALVLEFAQKHQKHSSSVWLLLSPIVAGLGYWFIFAPDIRFAHALFFLLPVTMMMIFLDKLYQVVKPSRNVMRIIIIVVVLSGSAHLLASIPQHIEEFAKLSNSGWYDIPTPPVERKVTQSGLGIYVPVGTLRDQQCLNAPLPCTPRGQFDPGLALLESGNLGAGFEIIP